MWHVESRLPTCPLFKQAMTSRRAEGSNFYRMLMLGA
jgi:hypothetical protein